MPFYEYQCTSCSHEETMLEKITASKTKACPACGQADVFKRLVSAAGFQLKGKGWYKTDFRDNGKPKDKPADVKPEKKKEPTDAAASSKDSPSPSKADASKKQA